MSSASSFKNWSLGIIGAVLTTVLVFAIEQKLTEKKEIVSVNGQVFDSGKRLLENVTVRLHVSSVNEEQKTDYLGRYAFSIEGFDPRLTGSMQLEAAGFTARTYNLTLQQMSAMQDLYLDSLGPAPPTGLGGAVDGTVTSHPAATRYVARIDAKRIAAAVRH
jgi:hypothetical protein